MFSKAHKSPVQEQQNSIQRRTVDQVDRQARIGFVDNRASTVLQRQIQEGIEQSEQVKHMKAYQQMANTSQAPIQRVVYDDMNQPVPIDTLLKIAEQNGVRETTILFALAGDGGSYTIKEALVMALEHQKDADMGVLEDYAYDSDGLEGNDEVIRDMELARKKGMKPALEMGMEEGMKRIAYAKRMMLQGEATAEDRKPIVIDTTGSGNFFEFQPNSFRKDVGAYKLEEEDAGLARQGGAKKYEALGREMDKMVGKLGISYTEANKYIMFALDGGHLSTHLGEDACAIFGELVAVLLTDMSRGSGAQYMIQEMLSQNTSFYSRFKEGGSYTPASEGGTKKIREFTDGLYE